MKTSAEVIILEDESDLKNMIIKSLRREGIEAIGYERGEALLNEFNNYKKPKVMIIDRCLPGVDGLSVIREIRKINKDVKIMIFSALSDPSEVIQGLEAGADDYLTKSTPLLEIAARIGFTLKKKREAEASIELDLATHDLICNGKYLKLTKREFEIFQLLFTQPGIAVNNEVLLSVLCQSAHIEQNNVPVHVFSLRKKIQEFDLEIETIRGIGYRLNRKPAA